MNARLKPLYLCASLLLAGCGYPEPSTVSADSFRASFRDFPGTLHLVLPQDAQNLDFVIRGNQLSYSVLKSAELPIGGFCGAKGISEQVGLPTADNLQPVSSLLAPSPDNSLMVVAAADAQEVHRLNHVLVLDRSRNVYTSVIKLAPGRRVKCLTWSPDSEFFASLETSSHVYSGNLKTAFSRLTGNPVFLSNYYLSIFDRSGKQLAQQLIASDVKAAWEILEWSAAR